MNNTQLHIQAQQFSLKRFPSNQFDKSLRAWDAGDEYLIDHVASITTLNELTHIVIVNDSFGALACAMSKLAPQAKISVFTDSYMTQRAIVQNLQGSNLDKNNVSIKSSLLVGDLIADNVDLVLIKIPRTLAYLDYLLLMLSSVFSNIQSPKTGPLLVGAGMVKLVTSSVMKLFDTHVTNTSTSLARKKARLLFAEFGTQSSQHETEAQLPPIHQVQDDDVPFTLHNYPNVFCREQVDIGARYMLKHLPNITKNNQTVVDLGCGNGILGISLLKKYPQFTPTLIFIDESHMAIASAKETLASCDIGETATTNARFIVGHCLEAVLQAQHMPQKTPNHVDYVICNPPFHQQSTVVDDIAWQMFVDAKKVLKIGGELRIVGNRHLDHRAKLSKLFGKCNVVASDKKFIVLSAIKRA